MLFQCALFAMKALVLALTLFLFIIKSKMIVALSWDSAFLVLSVRIWCWKRRRKPPNGNKGIHNIRPHPARPFIFWALTLLDNECKQGREATNKCNNMRALADPCERLAKAKFKYKIEFVSFRDIYWNLPLLNNDLKRGRQEDNESMSSEGEWQFLLECGLLPNTVLCGQNQSYSRL